MIDPVPRHCGLCGAWMPMEAGIRDGLLNEHGIGACAKCSQTDPLWADIARAVVPADQVKNQPRTPPPTMFGVPFERRESIAPVIPDSLPPDDELLR